VIIYTFYADSLDLSFYLWHRIRYEKRYLSEIIGLEIESEAKTAFIAGRKANRKDLHLKRVWSQ